VCFSVYNLCISIYTRVRHHPPSTSASLKNVCNSVQQIRHLKNGAILMCLESFHTHAPVMSLTNPESRSIHRSQIGMKILSNLRPLFCFVFWSSSPTPRLEDRPKSVNKNQRCPPWQNRERNQAFVYTYTHQYIFIYMKYIHTCVQKETGFCLYIHIYIHVYTYVYLCMYIEYVYENVCVCVHIYMKRKHSAYPYMKQSQGKIMILNVNIYTYT